MGSREGVMKTAAQRVGLTLDEYEANVAAGLKWCWACVEWQPIDDFAIDRSRGDGRVARCRAAVNVKRRMVRVLSAPSVQVHNAATNAVRTAIRRGELPAPTSLTCADCPEAAEQYHHFIGYEPEHWLDVLALCRSCHLSRHWKEPDGADQD